MCVEEKRARGSECNMSAQKTAHGVYVKGLPDDERIGEMQMAVKKMFKVAGRIKKIRIFPLVRCVCGKCCTHGECQSEIPQCEFT